MRVHEGWTRKPEPPSPTKPLPPPRTCNACGREFQAPSLKAIQQVYCTAVDCVRARNRARQQERRRLQKMMEDAERKKQEYDVIGKAQMAEVKQAFRETREARKQ